MIKKIALSLIAVLGICTLAFAQNKQVTGVVTDEAGEPIIGATVQVEGTTLGAATDLDGQFTLMAPVNATLEISYTGYETQKVSVTGTTNVNVILSDSSIAVEGVVVMGYGTGKKITSVIGQVDQVKAAKLENRPSANMADALQGQVAGMQVMTANGELNTTSSIRIHGIGSVSAGSEPLILLDGSPISAGTLLQLNQNDIASINVLKDASATSIYGSRASNGVIYVMTKTGRRDRGEAAEVTLRTQYSLTGAVTPVLKPMNTKQYLDFMGNYNAYNDGYDVTQGDYQTHFETGRADWINNFPGIDESVDTNFWDEYLRKDAPTYQIDLSVNGGSQKTSYYISGGYLDQTGILPGSYNHRYNFRSNFDTRATDWMQVGMNFGLGYSEGSVADTNDELGGLYLTSPTLAAMLTPPFQSLYNEDGSMKDYLEYMSINPLVRTKYEPQLQSRMQLNGAAFIQLTPMKGLTIRSQLSADGVYWNAWKSFRSTRPLGVNIQQGTGDRTETFQRAYTWTWTNTAEYRHTWNDVHNFTALLGHETIYSSDDITSLGVRGITSSEYISLSMGSEVAGLPSSSISRSASNSIFGRLEYNYGERYFADVTLRNDASSRFAKKHRNALFYAVSGMWNIKRENFLIDNAIITDLSLSASYGTQGNSAIGNYAHLRYFGHGTQYNGVTSWGLASMGNPDLTWENQALLNVGFKMQLWQKLNIDFSYYRRETTDLLMSIPLAPSAGYGSKAGNVGSMRNTGVDLTISYDIYQTKDWYVNFRTTFNYNKNQMTELWDKSIDFRAMGDGLRAWSVGDPLLVWYIQEWRGVDPEDGLDTWTYTDPKGNKGVTKDFNQADYVNLHKSFIAPYTGGFGITGSWKGIMLTADFSWVAGNYGLNNWLYFVSRPDTAASSGTNLATEAFDYWQKPGDNTRYPRLNAISEGNNQGIRQGIDFDSRLIESGSFLRLKNLQLSYTLPEHIMAKTKFIKGLKVWVGARNLWTVTGYKGLDPEAVERGVDVDAYPNTRQYTFGLEFKF